MRPDEVDGDAALVRRLVAGQFPRWASLPVERLESSGTENAVFRLGADKVVRLPRCPGAVESVAHERLWPERLGPRLSVAAPVPPHRCSWDRALPVRSTPNGRAAGGGRCRSR
ncbi:hypothetical protein ACF09K_17375 [Streptomyces sp. NPDC014882]|uniref:hypothetical protein n=1 Tax=Streptomyces sp. NPDC014882 TaxID=3364927 RepID=UPI0036FF97E1